MLAIGYLEVRRRILVASQDGADSRLDVVRVGVLA